VRPSGRIDLVYYDYNRATGLMDADYTWTVTTDGVTRTDTGTEQPAALKDVDESPLGVQPYQAYRFVTTSFTIELSAAPARWPARDELPRRDVLLPYRARTGLCVSARVYR